MLVALALVAAPLVGAWLVGGALIAAEPRDVGPPPDDLGAVEIELVTRDGRALAGWHVRAPGHRGVVVLAHSIRATRRQMTERARWLAGLGFSSVLFDLSAHGESPGDVIGLGAREADDVRAAVAFAKHEHPGEPLAVIGASLGGAAAVLAGPLGVDALVVEAVYTTIDDAVRNRVTRRLGGWSAPLAELLLAQVPLRTGAARDELRPIDAIAAVDAPLLVLGGTADERTPSADTEALFDAARGPKRLHLFDGVGHVDLERAARDAYRAVVGAWLDRCFAPTDALELVLRRDPSRSDHVYGLSARITNHGDRPVTLVGCLDRSDAGWRRPHVRFEVRLGDEVVPDDGTLAGCGHLDALLARHVVDVGPGESFDPFDGERGFWVPMLPVDGLGGPEMWVRLHYRTDGDRIDDFGCGVSLSPQVWTPELRARVARVPPVHLVSDWVEIP